MVKTKVPVKEFMIKDVLTVDSSESLKKVAKKLYAKRVGSAIIMENNQPIGIITNRDIVNGIGSFEISLDSSVSKIMSKPLIHVSPDESILMAAEIMNKKNIRKIPVIEKGQVVGIISASDLAIILTMIKEEEIEKVVRPYFSG